MQSSKSNGSLFRSINYYHNTFYSYTKIVKRHPLWAIGSLLFFLLFSISLVFYLAQKDTIFGYIRLSKNQHLGTIVVFQVLSMACWGRLYLLRDKLVVSTLIDRAKTESSTLKEVRSEWINVTFGVTRTGYLGLAKEINELLELKKQNTHNLSLNRKQLLQFLLIDGTHTRFFNALLAISAAIVALSIAGGANLDTVFEFYKSYSFGQLVGLYFIVTLVLMFFYCALVYLTQILIFVWDITIANLDGLSSQSDVRARRLIVDLLDLYKRPVGKLDLKVNSESRLDTSN